MGGLPKIYTKAKESVCQVVLSGMFTRKRIREGLGRDPVTNPTRSTVAGCLLLPVKFHLEESHYRLHRIRNLW